MLLPVGGSVHEAHYFHAMTAGVKGGGEHPLG